MTYRTTKIVKWCKPQECENSVWEKAFFEFETRKEAVKKMKRRLREYKIADKIEKNSIILDLFCGTGHMSEALRRLGYKNTVGLDISLSLLKKNNHSKKLVCGNATQMRFRARSFKAIFIQGGLHHLPKSKADTFKVFRECRRILEKGGYIFVTEPYEDFFLKTVHYILEKSPWLPARLKHLKTMIREEKKTYFSWLGKVHVLLAGPFEGFEPVKKQIGWGKISLVLRRV